MAPSKALTPAEMIEKFDRLIKTAPNLRARTMELYSACVAAFVAYAGADPDVYNAGIVEDWLGELKKERKPQTVNVYRKAIRFVSRRFAKHKLGEDFAADVDKVKVDPAKPRVPLTYGEAERLLATCTGDSLIEARDRVLITVALRTGLRRGGLLALEIAGVRVPESVITTINKGGASLSFKADEVTIAALVSWIGRVRPRRHARSGISRRSQEQASWRYVCFPGLACLRPACQAGRDPSCVSTPRQAFYGDMAA